MPIYEYRCLTCGYEFEEFQSINDAPIDRCSSCDGPVQKLISNVGISFKGTGFYVNDSRSTVKTTQTSTTPSKTEVKTDNPAKDETPTTPIATPKPETTTKTTDPKAS